MINTLKNWMRLPDTIRPKKKIEIETIDEVPSVKSNIAEIFYEEGFEREGNVIVLWPSGV